MDITAFFDTDTATVSYLIADPKEGVAAIIDPVADFDAPSGTLGYASAERLLEIVKRKGVRLDWILETHAHADHLSAAAYIREKTGARIGIGARIGEVQAAFRDRFAAADVTPDGSVFDRLFEDGARFQIGALEARVMHTPGHTPACVTYLIEDAAFVGDTLFMPDFGTARTDFPGGDARTLFRSVRRILSLPPETRIFTGHDYPPAGRDEPAWEATVALQRRDNIHVHDGVMEDEFVAKREARDVQLGAPRLLLPSLQVNIRAGALPPPDEAGRVMLRLPVTLTA